MRQGVDVYIHLLYVYNFIYPYKIKGKKDIVWKF